MDGLLTIATDLWIYLFKILLMLFLFVTPHLAHACKSIWTSMSFDKAISLGTFLIHVFGASILYRRFWSDPKNAIAQMKSQEQLKLYANVLPELDKVCRNLIRSFRNIHGANSAYLAIIKKPNPSSEDLGEQEYQMFDDVRERNGEFIDCNHDFILFLLSNRLLFSDYLDRFRSFELEVNRMVTNILSVNNFLVERSITKAELVKHCEVISVETYDIGQVANVLYCDIANFVQNKVLN